MYTVQHLELLLAHNYHYISISYYFIITVSVIFFKAQYHHEKDVVWGGKCSSGRLNIYARLHS